MSFIRIVPSARPVKERNRLRRTRREIILATMFLTALTVWGSLQLDQLITTSVANASISTQEQALNLIGAVGPEFNCNNVASINNGTKVNYIAPHIEQNTMLGQYVDSFCAVQETAARVDADMADYWLVTN